MVVQDPVDPGGCPACRRAQKGRFGQASRCFAVFFLVCLFAAGGCASAKLERSRAEFYRGDIDRAARTLEDPGGIPKRSLLLYYMEKGMVEFTAGRHEESIRALRSAAGIISDLEKISVGRQGGSLITSERITEYRGEYAERLLVHTYLMMNYLLLRQFEGALVEAKKALEVMDDYPGVLRADHFTRALAAHCFEAAGEVNGAYIEYRKLAQDMDDPGAVAEPLYRLAMRQGFSDEAEKYAGWLKKDGRSIPDRRPPAEVVVFAAAGKGPVKVPVNIVAPPSVRFSFAGYRKRSSAFFRPELANGINLSQTSVTTDVSALLKKSLGARAARIFAKETARVAAKETIASNIDDPLAETLARIVFFVTQEPDTRAWETLPARLSMIRAPLEPGTNSLRVRARKGGQIALPEIVVNKQAPFRYYHYAVRF